MYSSELKDTKYLLFFYFSFELCEFKMKDYFSVSNLSFKPHFPTLIISAFSQKFDLQIDELICKKNSTHLESKGNNSQMSRCVYFFPLRY